jgi:soluble lytic murein transglycosylase-like protein
VKNGRYFWIILIFVIVFCVSFLYKTLSSSKTPLVSPEMEIVIPDISTIEEASESVKLIASPSSVLAYTDSVDISLTGVEIASSTPTMAPNKIIVTPSPATSEEVNGYIERFSSQFAVDPDVLRYVAICESGFRSNAVNGPYVGLYQFGSVTWKNIRKEIGENSDPDLRFEAKDSVQTAAYAISKGKGGMWPNCMP